MQRKTRGIAWLAVATSSAAAALALALLAVLRHAPAPEGAHGATVSISQARFARATTGMTPKHVRALLGRPDSRNETTFSSGPTTCWYYGVEGAANSWYQVCFERGVVAYTGRYG